MRVGHWVMAITQGDVDEELYGWPQVGVDPAKMAVGWDSSIKGLHQRFHGLLLWIIRLGPAITLIGASLMLPPPCAHSFVVVNNMITPIFVMPFYIFYIRLQCLLPLGSLLGMC